MEPYSHLVIASKLKHHIMPENLQEYFWGAIAPDIRYIAHIERSKTHISPRNILTFTLQYPYLKSFLQGYLVHCLTDKVDFQEMFPITNQFHLFSNKNFHLQMTVALELFYFEHERLNLFLSDSHNEVLLRLGIEKSYSEKFSHSISKYLMSSSPETCAFNFLKLVGSENQSLINSYETITVNFQSNNFLRSVYFNLIKLGRVSEKIILSVLSSYDHCIKNHPEFQQ